MRSRNVFPCIVLLLMTTLLSSCSVMESIVRVGYGFVAFVVFQMVLIISALTIRVKQK